MVLVGPGASGKSTWAAAHFPPDAVVSSDRLRAVVGAGEDDVTASDDAFAVLDDVVRMRVGRGRTTVVDTLGLDPVRRAAWRELARATPDALRGRRVRHPGRRSAAPATATGTKRIPADVLTAQLRGWPAVRDGLAGRGSTRSSRRSRSAWWPPRSAQAAAAARRQREEPTGLRFGLHLSEFAAPGGAAETRGWLRETAAAAEAAGFDAIYVMDHFRQIPQVGRPFDDLLESWTTLAYLAACTETGPARDAGQRHHVPQRRAPRGRSSRPSTCCPAAGRCAGSAWRGSPTSTAPTDGTSRPPVTGTRCSRTRCSCCRVLWGPGSKPYRGRVLDVPETLCYPRPLQDHVPLVVGGGGEQRTLRLAARYADAANVMGGLDVVRRKAAVLRRHCLDHGRDPAEVALSHLSTVAGGPRRRAGGRAGGRPGGRAGAARRATRQP